MSIKTRRFIYSAFIVFFILAAGYIVLYAMGYKYNWPKKIFERTGVFFIKSYPKDSEVYLNNIKQKEQTPALINRLLPNFYQIKVGKTGYFDWQKNLSISPDTTTFIEDISLFKSNQKIELLASGNFNSPAVLSGDQQLAVLAQTDKTLAAYWLLNIADDTLVKFYEASANNQVEIISFSNNNQRLLVKQKNQYWIFNLGDLTRSQPLALSDISKLSFVKLIWDSYNDNVLYGLAGGRAYELNLLNKSVAQLSQDAVLNLINYKTDVVAIIKKDNLYWLQFLKINREPILSLPYSANYFLFNPGYDYLTLFDQDQNTLYLLSPENQAEPLKTVIKNVKRYDWHEDQFVYWSNNELWVYFPDVNKKILIERTSQPIVSAFWHSNVVYIFCQTDDAVKVFELDSRDQRNSYTLLNFEQPDNFVFPNKKGNFLYSITSINGRRGLYKAEIQ